MAYGSPNDGEQVRDRQHDAPPPPTEQTNLLSDEGRCSLYKTISVSFRVNHPGQRLLHLVRLDAD
jgi:hypothetical protein